ncbi:hypothetical protein [Altererythrobacter ishigakiensis]|uniref:Uncharacterized protein n=1 Tax=Altererythrobacter ishigakiensis TaxID=476157 RepID=A0A562UW47_9SPHN|nr:hypothetical protein [Altererythrobacter ishigakiensis]TWJ09852.1 hypothetical protein JN10_1500 [Altererythrobacter ishigakiensis]
MARWKWASAGVAAVALSASFVAAQDAPESLLPPGFDDPAPAPPPSPTPASPATPVPPQSGQSTAQASPDAPAFQALPNTGDPLNDLAQFDFSSIPTLDELEQLSPDELDDLLGLSPSYDIPPAARRAMTRVGVISSQEGGFPSGSLAKQPSSLVEAALRGLERPIVSRWGHILLRRALASRLEAPAGMSPVEFAELRAKALNKMGEYRAARALLQDIDTGNWDSSLVDAGLEAYIATTDLIGACPIVRLRASARDDAQWRMLGAICNSYAGEAVLGGRQLDRALRDEIAPEIDILLAQRLAGAAGRGRRAVDVEWDGVNEINPWRFAIANAVGEEIPESLRSEVEPYYERIWASTPTLSLQQRAIGADRAAREGIFSARAIVDLYSQIYADENISGPSADRATLLREAYVGASASERVSALQSIWENEDSPDYGRYVMTAFAAARVPASPDLADQAPALLASMLAAGLDRDAATWAQIVEPGSAGWALVALARQGEGRMEPREAIDGFIDEDGSANKRRSALLLAGLAGLDRISANDLSDFTTRTGADLTRESRWSRAISQAADVNNATLVALLAGLGMQGEGWDRMTPRHLYHIVSALRRVGLNAEARMIAAEAMARG